MLKRNINVVFPGPFLKGSSFVYHKKEIKVVVNRTR